jgi:hypothetical protein
MSNNSKMNNSNSFNNSNSNKLGLSYKRLQVNQNRIFLLRIPKFQHRSQFSNSTKSQENKLLLNKLDKVIYCLTQQSSLQTLKLSNK